MEDLVRFHYKMDPKDLSDDKFWSLYRSILTSQRLMMANLENVLQKIINKNFGDNSNN